MLDLPFNGVKLDGSLAAVDDAAVAEAEAIVGIAKRNGQYVVAEGIENAAAVARMRALGADALQGFFFCRPMPAPALRIWAEAWETLIGAESAMA
jgi:EAL domain-containing protein (putative c-di-GMP-specific phosphodiesterase class I)